MDDKIKKHYNASILKEACSHYEINFKDAKLIRDFANLIFDCGNKILRLSHSCNRYKNEIEAELDWLLFLKEKDLPVVKILTSKQKKYLVQIGTDENHFTVVCFKKIVGKKVSDEDWNAQHFEKLGNLTGLLHREGQNYKEQPEIEYQHWNETVEFRLHNYLPQDERNLLALHNLLVDEFVSYPKSKVTYGLIHYDIHQGNYLLSGNEKQIILFDFEMTCKSWYINDVAAVLHYASYYPASLQIENFDAFFLENFWKGYERAYRLEKSEHLKIPKFVLYRDLMVYAVLHKLYPSQPVNSSFHHYLNSLSASIEKRRLELKI